MAIRFPAICMPRVDEPLVVCRSVSTLTTATWKGVSAGWYSGLLIIDNDGHSFEVTDVRVVSPQVGILRILSWMINGKVELALQTARSASLDFEQVRELVERNVEEHADFFASACDTDELIKGVSRCVGISELINLLESCGVSE